jgi:arylsulfatase A-like enzyme
MVRRRLRDQAVTALLLALVAGSAGCRRAHPVAHPIAPKANVVLVVIDTLRRDHLATYGYRRDTAPFLGELARQGSAFDGLTPAPWTKPATASLLTGLHPVHHQAVGRLDRVPAAAVLLAERLRGEGYHTLGASANGWVTDAFGFERGFDSFFYWDNFKAAALDRELLPKLERLKPPFFLYVHYVDPHLPYAPDIGWDGRPLSAAERPLTVEEADATHFAHRSPQLLARARDLYDGEIRQADDGLRELVGQLARRGLMKNTVLVVTADHGEELEEHGRMSHGQSVYQEVLQVPLVIRAPGAVPAGRRPGRASLMDVVPTLLDLLGMSPPDGAPPLDGVSLAGRLTGSGRQAPDDRSFLAHLDFIDGTGLSVTRGRHKLVLGKNPYRKELFDLAADPGERHNLLGRPEAGAVFAQLSGELARLYNGYARQSLERSDGNLDPVMARRLAALGYSSSGRSQAQRVVPRRIEPADPYRNGRLGWANPGSVANCIQMGKPDASPSFLAGWYEPEGAGRWSAQEGTLVLTAPGTSPRSVPTELRVSGNNFRPSPVRVTLSVNRHPVLESELKAGPFRLAASLAGVPLSDLDLVEISTDSAFVPARIGLPDQRSLGLYLTTVCLEPENRSGRAGGLP